MENRIERYEGRGADVYQDIYLHHARRLLLETMMFIYYEHKPRPGMADRMREQVRVRPEEVRGLSPPIIKLGQHCGKSPRHDVVQVDESN